MHQSKVNEAAVKAEPQGEWPSGLRRCNQNQKVTICIFNVKLVHCCTEKLVIFLTTFYISKLCTLMQIVHCDYEPSFPFFPNSILKYSKNNFHNFLTKN